MKVDRNICVLAGFSDECDQGYVPFLGFELLITSGDFKWHRDNYNGVHIFLDPFFENICM